MNEESSRNAAEEPWEFTTESATVWDLPFYRSGYVDGWRAAMAEAKGGDWSQEIPPEAQSGAARVQGHD